MERETGIEPATNSLEGCDSTTELLPPSTTDSLLLSAFAGLQPGSRSEGRLVAREGLEPSKPLGRQIYSLLRLTASLPRQLFLLNVSSTRTLRRSSPMELADGFEPPTC